MGDYIEDIPYGTMLVLSLYCMSFYGFLIHDICYAVETSKNLIYYDNSTAMVEPGGHRSLGMTLKWDSTSGSCCYCCVEMV